MKKNTRHATRAVAASLAVVGTLSLSACGGDSGASDTTSAAMSDEATPGVTVSKQWARTSPMAATMGAAYMDLVSAVDDTLIGAKVDASVAKVAEIHETVMVGDEMSSDTTSSDTTMEMDDHNSDDMSSDTTMAMSGEMKMQKVDAVEVKAGEALSLKPGGYHVMLMELVNPLTVGDTIQVTLTFEKAGDVVVDVPVRDEAP